MSRKVYILLPVHNRRAITQSFIADLQKQTCVNFHLLLIDDGSTDGTGELVCSMVKNVTVIRGAGDWWWAGSLQQGIEWLKRNRADDEDIIMMINDDVKMHPDFIERGCSLLKPRVLVQATICDDKTHEVLDDGMVFDERRLSFRRPEGNEEVNCLTTNGLFLFWQDVQKIGGFHSKLLPHYLSDYEYTIRAHRIGLRLMVSPELKLYWNRETTGIREIDEYGMLPFMKKFFSKKSAGNPVYWTSFILLACPMRYVPFHLAKVWAGTLFAIARQAAGLPHRRTRKM